jgi:SAM-dependent methyltransferase
VCGSGDLTPVIEIDGIPVFCNVLWPSREEALAAPKGDIRLVQCRGCTHFFNQAFDPILTEYTTAYENSLHFSERFNEFARNLAARLIDTYDLQGKDVVDVGCGRGDFLRMLCDMGGNRGVGFDRSHDLEADDQTGGAGEVRFVADFLTAAHPRLPVDLLSCRHVLEHIPEPLAFLTDLREWLGPRSGAVTYFEVPNALYTVERGGIWDLIYEHCSYYTVESLFSLFERAGFFPHAWGESFGGQYLYLQASLRPDSWDRPTSPGLDRGSLGASVGGFRGQFHALVDDWRQQIGEAERDGKRLALWGIGSKGVTFLNLLDPGPVFRHVVDINPNKHGRSVPGTGQVVVSPRGLQDDHPEIVVVTNALYVDEIEAEIERLGVDATVQAV